MNFIEKVSELLARKAEIALGGGKDKQLQQKKSDSMTARERIQALLDEGSFVEIGGFASSRNEDTAADGVVTGYGSVDGRLIYVYSQDHTVLNGAVGEVYAQKVVKIFDMAQKMGAPVIGMLDSDGVRLKDGVLAQSFMGSILTKSANLSGVVPNISIVFGNCIGSSAILACMSDFVIINEKTGKLFVNGPSVIEAATGTKPISAKETGDAHLYGKTDDECIEKAKLLISYLPSNNLSDAFEFETNDDINRTTDSLVNLDAFEDCRVIISEVADDKAFFEIGEGFGEEIITGFIRMNGSSVGVLSTNGKELTQKSANKGARFVRTCDAFNIPIVTFTDVDGFKVSAQEEADGLSKKCASLMFAFSEATVGKVNLIVKKAYGTAYALFNSKETGADIVFAYPTSEMAPLSPQQGVIMLYADRLKKGESRDALIAEYKEKTASIYEAAKRGLVDDIIDPSETRARLIAALEMLKSKRANGVSRKHDNMPL